ncbi:hypothetical protein [Endozoicomonas sp.]|nr:hypothetical protein [Endozoicomonas sp.]
MATTISFHLVAQGAILKRWNHYGIPKKSGWRTKVISDARKQAPITR